MIVGQTIGRTNVGSHMWNMQRPDSDLDIFEIYMANTTEILLERKQKSYCKKIPGIPEKRIPEKDISGHEIGKVVKMILDGNVNFIWGVFSPIIYTDSGLFKELRQLAALNHSQQAYHSINGLAVHNVKHLKQEGLTEKKARTILRTIQFGIDYLNSGIINFKSYTEQLPNDFNSTVYFIDSQLEILKSAKEYSILPEKPENRELLENWLISQRKNKLYGWL